MGKYLVNCCLEDQMMRQYTTRAEALCTIVLGKVMGNFVIVTLMIFLVPFLVSPVLFGLCLINSILHANGIANTWSSEGKNSMG